MRQYLLQCSYVLQPHTHEHTTSSLIPLIFISILFASYGLAAFIRWRDTGKWHWWSVVSFVTGCILAGICFSSPFVDYAHHSFKGHMIQHLLLGMLAPIGLVIGAPVLLALQTLPKNTSKKLSTILNSRLFHLIGNPITALVLNMGTMYVLYLTPLYNNMHESTVLHLVVHFHFLAAGYLFTWTMIGPDPAPRRPKLFTRVLVLFVSIAAHAYLSKFMFAYNYPRNSIHSEAEIQAAAKIMYYGGDIIELLLVIALFTIWYNKKGKPYYRFLHAIKGI